MAGGAIEVGEGRGARGEGRGAKGEGQGRRLAAVHAAFIWRGKRHAEQVASAEQVACLLYWFLGHAVWLPGDCAVAIVSVVRTGMARSSLECWLFILSAVAWPEVGVRSAS